MEKLAGKYLDVPSGKSPPPLSYESVDPQFYVLAASIYHMAVRSYKAEKSRDRSERALEQTRQRILDPYPDARNNNLDTLDELKADMDVSAPLRICKMSSMQSHLPAFRAA